MKRSTDRPITRRRFARGLLAGVGTLVGCRQALAPRVSTGVDDPALRLLFFTDVHARTDREIPRALERASRAISRESVDVIIAGGDLISGGFASSEAEVAPRWDAYLAMQDRIENRVYPVLGNHDLVAAAPDNGQPASSDPRASFRYRLGLDRTYYSFDTLGYHFVVLDSVYVTGGELRYEGRVPADQLEWLERDLAGVAAERPIVLATHMPLLTALYGATEGATAAAPVNRVVVNSLEVLELLSGYNLVLVLQGHLHVREVIRWRGTTFLTGGAICGSWWNGPRYGAEEGFYVLDLHRHQVDCRYVDYGWEVPA